MRKGQSPNTVYIICYSFSISKPFLKPYTISPQDNGANGPVSIRNIIWKHKTASMSFVAEDLDMSMDIDEIDPGSDLFRALAPAKEVQEAERILGDPAYAATL
jgi:hypothetical protein